MNLILQYTSNLDKEHIKEAAKIDTEAEAIFNGWAFIGSGVYKNSYKKGQIVLKFARRDGPHMINEVYFYNKTSKNNKKYLARIFGGNKEKIIQRYVESSLKEYSNKERNELYKLGRMLGIHDFHPGANVIKTKENKIIFYDFAGQCIYY